LEKLNVDNSEKIQKLEEQLEMEKEDKK